MAADGDDCGVQKAAGQLDDHVQSVHLGHLDIGNDHVRRDALIGGESISIIAGFGDLRSLFLEYESKQATDAGFILNIQDLGHARRLSLAQETPILVCCPWDIFPIFTKAWGGMIEHPYGDWQAPSRKRQGCTEDRLRSMAG